MSFSFRDQERLRGVLPALTTLLARVFEEQQAAGAPMFVVMGVRTTAEQQALYAQGRTAPGKIVTMKDGVVHKSNHQLKEDGFGHGVDCAFIGSDPFEDKHDWEAFGRRVEAHGGTWGGRWAHPHDAPHVEL
jgi:peptidoglycan L-alanyl-D-glutamate endopeptidase CwlK